MKKLWLLFSQVVTVLLACWFVVATMQPNWLGRGSMFGAQKQDADLALQAPPPETLRSAAKTAAPAVVSIITSPDEEPVFAKTRNDKSAASKLAEEEDEEDIFSGMGSGVIVSSDGYILTNSHVLEESENIEVLLNDGRRAEARIIGTDPDTDLAVLKVELSNLPAIALGDSGSLQVGDSVLAIGNPFGVGQTVTSGIVSALGRSQLGISTFENFIQTDAAINPGNSGGALVDIHGKLVGINTAIYSRTGGYMGIGFATPTSMAKKVFEDIVQTGHVTRGWIGVEPSDITAELAAALGVPENSGTVVTGVLPGSPAARAALQPGDIITRVNKNAVRNVQDLLAMVAALSPGSTAELAVQRKGQALIVPITPEQRPKPDVAR